MKPSKYQREIFNTYTNTNNNIIVLATAGSGKSHTLRELAKLTPPFKKVGFFAFNKSIATELDKKTPPHILCSTIHSMGAKALYREFDNLKLSESKSWKFVNEALKDKKVKKSYKTIIQQLMVLYRLYMCDSEESLQNVAQIKGISIQNGEIKDTLRAIYLMDKYNDKARNTNEFLIDFTDMLYLPVKWGLPVRKFDVVMVDECFPYDTYISLGDSKMKIGEICERVNRGEAIYVNSYNEKQNIFELKRVTKAWEKGERELTGLLLSTGQFVKCTPNHKFLTDTGWKEAQNIRINKDILYISNDHHYDIALLKRRVKIPEKKVVYDIEVKYNHNFIVCKNDSLHGIVAHNCQDLNNAQMELVKKAMKGRFIMVGDEKQAIYEFMGSTLSVIESFKKRPNTVCLPLSISYRCAKNIVLEAQKVFGKDSVEYADNAPNGVVRKGKLLEAQDGDFILCRNNQPLVSAWILLLENNIPAHIFGKDLADQIEKIIDTVDGMSWAGAAEVFSNKVENIVEKLTEQGVNAPFSHPKVQNYLEKVEIVGVLYDKFGDFSLIKEKLGDIFSDDTKDGVILITIHRSKGLEADRVFFHQPELIPSKYAITAESKYAEKCLKFVAITRAKSELIYC